MKDSIIRYSVGIDVSKDKLAVCLKALTESEREVIKGGRKFPNTLKGFEALAQWMEAKRKDPDVAFRIVMEVTGIYHEQLVYFLHGAGYYVSVELAKRVKSYLKSLGQDTKTDKEDAAGLASMALHRKLKQWQPVSPMMNQIRQLVRYRDRLIDSQVRFRNQSHAVELSQSPVAVVSQGLKLNIKSLKDQILELEKQILILLKQDEKLFQRVKQITDSLPGIGLITMVKILAETDGFSCTRSAKQLTRYAGFDIIERESGTFRGKTRISKNGNARLRTAMYMPALAHVRSKEGAIYRLYIRLLMRNGGIKKKALVAVQRKLLCLVYSLWKSGQAYDPNYQQVKTQ